MPRIVVVWKDNCPKCDYVKGMLNSLAVLPSVKVETFNGIEPERQTFLKEHDINAVPVVLFYNNDGSVMKATRHTARGMDEDFKRHTGQHLFVDFA